MTRSDVLAGRASEEEALALMRSSLQLAGGQTVPGDATEPPSTEPSGGGYPILAVDLDGDGDEEAIVLQPISNYLAVDGRGVLWRERPGEGVRPLWPTGFVTGNFSGEGGQEVLFVGIRFDPSSISIVLALSGASGLIWKRALPGYWVEFTGVAEADKDPLSDVAVSIWDGTGLRVHVIDGEDGTTLRALASTLGGSAGSRVSESAFVTGGSAGQSDEAVFVTRLGPGYVAERQRLSNGEMTARKIVPVAPSFELYQGPDYTGDGRRDAYALQLLWPAPPAPPPPPGVPQRWSYGVFDADTMELRWMRDIPSDGNPWFVPYLGGDVNGDGAQEVCHVIMDRERPGEMRTESAEARCESGAGGTTLWEVSRQVTAKSVYAYADAPSDLDGDGFLDPVLYLVGWECAQGWWECPTTVDEAVAFSGKDGSLIWDSEYTTVGAYYFSGSDLDGTPGDDAFFPLDAGGPDGPFRVWNGRTLSPSWDGVVDTGGMEGWAILPIGADVNGDGGNEAVVTAAGVEFVDHPWCGECKQTVVHGFVSAIRPGGSTVWNFEH